MVIEGDREGAEVQLVAALRGTFDASVMNFGSYNILYALNLLAPQEAGADGAAAQGRARSQLSVQEGVTGSRHLLVGYRRRPVEMVLCPVDLSEALPRAAGADVEPASEVPLPVNLTNLAGMATEDSTLELVLSTGHRLKLDVRTEMTFTDLPDVVLTQQRDVDDFCTFVDYFMDTVDEDHPQQADGIPDE